MQTATVCVSYNVDASGCIHVAACMYEVQSVYSLKALFGVHLA